LIIKLLTGDNVDVEQFKRDAETMSVLDLVVKYNSCFRTVNKWKKMYGCGDSKRQKELKMFDALDKEQFKEDVKNMNNAELMVKYGVARRAISNWRKKLGVSNVWRKQMISVFYFDKDAKVLSGKELQKKYGASKSSVALWKQQRGLTTGKRENKPVSWVKDGLGCWICTSHELNDKGYPQCKEHKLVAIRVWVEKNGVWPEGSTCSHVCDNSLCINPDHIKPVVRSENGKEMGVRHRSPWGDRNGVRKLSSELAREIYALKGIASQRKIGERFGVSGSTVFNIWAGKTWWRDVEGMENFPVKLTQRLVGKLTWSGVRSLKSMKGKMSTRKAGEIYGLSNVEVWKIWQGKSWAEVN
jgi:hypothetical protein